MAETAKEIRDRHYNEAKKNKAPPPQKEVATPIAPVVEKQMPAGMGGYSSKGDRVRKEYIDSVIEQDHSRGYTKEKWE